MMQEVFVEPVRAADGYAYERSSITAWLRDHDTSPATNVPLPNKRLQTIPGAVAFMQRLVAELSSDAKDTCRENGLYVHLL